MNKEKLRVLANHLISGEASDKFFFGDICSCAINETAELFNLIRLEQYIIEWKNDKRFEGAERILYLNKIEKVICNLFNLNKNEYEYLFFPLEDCDDWAEYEEKQPINYLGANATAAEVGKLILHYIKTGGCLTRSEKDFDFRELTHYFNNDIDIY